MAKFDKVIPPGQEGVIKLVVAGNKVSGSFSKSAAVHTNDPDHPVMNLMISGNEVPYVTVTPTGRVYLQGRYGEKAEKVVTIASNEDLPDFKVLGAESNIDDKITYKFEPGPRENEYTLKVWKNPKLPTLNTYGSLTLHTNSKHAPDKVIQVQVVTKGSITVQPTSINYGAVQFSEDGAQAKPVQKSVTLIKSDGEFSIENIEFDSDRYKANVREVVPGKRYTLEVTFSPPEKDKSRQRSVGQMIIHTDDPREPTLRVRLVARAM